jgi:hypothetical protein
MGTILNGISTIDEAAQESYITEHHVHARERWLSKMAVPSGGKVAEYGMTPFTLTSGNDTWGAYVQLLDINDTPSIPGYKFFDFRRVFVMDVDSTATYRVRFAYGNDTSTEAVAALEYTDFIYRVNVTNSDRRPVDVMMPRLPVGTKMWGSTWCDGMDAKILSLVVGGHLYLK